MDLEVGREVWYVLGAGIPIHMPGLAFLSLLGCLPVAQDSTVVGVGLFPNPPGAASSLCCSEQEQSPATSQGLADATCQQPLQDVQPTVVPALFYAS